MKIEKIKSAYIKNKPNYVYNITDQDNVTVATGHLLNTKQKQNVLKHMQNTIDQNGEVNWKITSIIDYYAEWIINSLDSWVWTDLQINKQNIYELDFQVSKWLAQMIQQKNNQSIQLVETNAKN